LCGAIWEHLGEHIENLGGGTCWDIYAPTGIWTGTRPRVPERNQINGSNQSRTSLEQTGPNQSRTSLEPTGPSLATLTEPEILLNDAKFGK
jgi:hypothetical protein